MRAWLIPVASVATAWAVVATVAASAETFSLQLRRLEAVPDRATGPPSDYVYRRVYPQSFYEQTGTHGTVRSQERDAEFAKVVTKEPESYNSKNPFRGVATLGTQKFGFVLDRDKPVVRAAADPDAPAVEEYNRLHFDLNGNGDLTDDPVIEVEAPDATHTSASYSYVQYSFPRVDLTIPVEESEVDYSFFFSVTSRGHANYQYTSASLTAAAYRQGEITLDGQELQIVLVDYNSNGRFDDLSMVDDRVTGPGSAIYQRQGDMIYVDPKPEEGTYLYGYDPTTNDDQYPLSKVLHLGGRFYDVSVTPAGDSLTLAPSPLPVGQVTNRNPGYRALVYGDQGIVKIRGDESGRAALPAGPWKLLMYTIDRTGDDQVAEKPSLLKSLADAVLRREDVTRPRFTMVAARGTRDDAAVEVREGETVELPFGPPYAPRVSGSYLQPDGRLRLEMSLVGVAGEVCSNMMVGGGRPPKPAFTIADPDGNIVERGTFEYG